MKVLRLRNKNYYLYLPFVPSGAGRDFLVNMTREYHYPDLKKAKVTVKDVNNFSFGHIYYRD